MLMYTLSTLFNSVIIAVKDISNFDLHCFLEICRNPQPLGMESKKIPDIEITASSTYAGDYYPYYARPGSDKCWYPENGKQKNSWIQVDLGKLTRLAGLETQGCASGWTKTYSLSFSADGKRWFSHANGTLKVCMN